MLSNPVVLLQFAGVVGAHIERFGKHACESAS